MSRLARRFILIGLALAATLLIGTVGFTVIENYPVFDAFYMTLTTMTTVGYGEIHPLSHPGRVFNSFLIFFGVTTIFIAMGAMTQTIIEMEFGDAGTQTLEAGGIARVDAATVRKIRNVGDGDAVYVVVGGADGYVGRDGLVPDEDEARYQSTQ